MLGQSGGVLVVQRTSSDLRLNPHVHAVFLDGVYREAEDGVTFHPLGRLDAVPELPPDVVPELPLDVVPVSLLLHPANARTATRMVANIVKGEVKSGVESGTLTLTEKEMCRGLGSLGLKWEYSYSLDSATRHLTLSTSVCATTGKAGDGAIVFQ